MAVLIVRNIEIEPNYYEELEPYLDKFGTYRIRDNKLQACSPFRYEKRPSFAVNLDNGSWIDSGATDDSMRKGHFTHLLAFLREETWFDTEAYLLDKYSTIITDVDTLQLTYTLDTHTSYRVFTKEELSPYMWRVNYLTNRGISEKIQRAFQIGYDKDNKAVMIPWHDHKGNVINMKFRSITQKKFWYHPEGQRIKHHVYGLHFIKKHDIKRVFAVEGETDALYLWTHGIPAIAFGGASMSKEQKLLLLRSPIEELVIATDNDAVGRRFARTLADELMTHFDILRLEFPMCYKDMNDIPPTEIGSITERNIVNEGIYYVINYCQ